MKKINLIHLTFALIALLAVSCKKPLGSFHADKATAFVGEPITFTNTSEDASTSSWDFGDGTNSSTDRLVQTPVYNTPGNYTVSLIVAKNSGKKPSQAPEVTIVITGAVAKFSSSNKTPAANEIVTFTSSSTDASSFAWDFGDGAIASTPTATHAFAERGTYIVRLTVKDASFTTVSTDSMTIVVDGTNGHANNLAKIVGSWKFLSKEVTDVRNGITFTRMDANSTFDSKAFNRVYTDTHEFTAEGSIIITDKDGNTTSMSSFEVIDDSRIDYNFGNSTNAYSTGTILFANYTVTASSLVIEYVSINSSLPAYKESAYPYKIISMGGEKQVITTTYTYEK